MTDTEPQSATAEVSPEVLTEAVAVALAETDASNADLHFDNDEPADARRKRRSVYLFAGAVSSFSLTLVAGSYAVMAGYIPLPRLDAVSRVDVGAALLFAPVCALAFALVFEAARLALKGPIELPQPRRAPIAWVPGRREG